MIESIYYLELHKSDTNRLWCGETAGGGKIVADSYNPACACPKSSQDPTEVCFHPVRSRLAAPRPRPLRIRTPSPPITYNLSPHLYLPFSTTCGFCPCSAHRFCSLRGSAATPTNPERTPQTSPQLRADSPASLTSLTPESQRHPATSLCSTHKPSNVRTRVR